MLDTPAAQTTERLLRDAGVGPGMRVLDAGCAIGRLTFELAQIVGRAGAVVGLDRNEASLARARETAAERGVSNVEFVAGDLLAPPLDRGPFDVVAGRRVLMYQPDPVAALRALLASVRPGGVAVFEEIDATMTPASTSGHPLHERVHGWLWDTVRANGGRTSMGFELAAALRGAGFELGGLRAEAVVQTAERRRSAAPVVRALRSVVVDAGVATEQEIDLETLDARLAEELQGTGGAYVSDMVFGAWARRPD